jgi:hypothetical protein
MANTRALVVLTPYESRRVIAKAVAKLPAVENAMKNGLIIVSTGTSTGYVAEELLGQPMVKENFVSGHIVGGETWDTPKNPDYIYPVVLRKGKRESIIPEDALKEFTADDVFVKGANAVDPQYRAAVFAASGTGGTMGWSMGTVLARGAHLVMPVGLEKMIPDVLTASKHAGNRSIKYSMGSKVGMVPVVTATVVTEIQAFEQLFGIEAFYAGAGGIAGSEGSVVLILEGEDAKVAKAFEFAKSIKGEKPLNRPYGTPVQSGVEKPLSAKAGA